MKRSESVLRMMKSRNSRSGIKIKNSRRKKNKFRVTTRQVLMVVFMVVLFMGSGIGYVWSNYELTQIGYDISRLEKEEMRLMEMNRKLRLELAMKKSMPKLEEIAIKKLGLKQPSPEQIIVLP